MLSHRLRLILLTLLVVSGLAAGATWLARAVFATRQVAAFTAPHGYRLAIIGHPATVHDWLDCEPWNTFEYELKKGSETVARNYLGGSSFPFRRIQFSLRTSPDGRHLYLLARDISSHLDPTDLPGSDSVVMICDTETGKRWPGHGTRDWDSKRFYARAERLHAQVRGALSPEEAASLPPLRFHSKSLSIW